MQTWFPGPRFLEGSNNVPNYSITCAFLNVLLLVKYSTFPGVIVSDEPGLECHVFYHLVSFSLNESVHVLVLSHKCLVTSLMVALYNRT